MQLSILSWSPTGASSDATTDINNGTAFSAWYDTGQILVPERTPLRVARNDKWPKLSGVNTDGVDYVFKIRCLGTIHSQRETIKRYFSPDEYTIGMLTFADAANSSKEWYIKGMPVRVNEETPGIMAVTLALDEPFLREVAETTASWAITASGQTTDVSVTGNLSANPVLTITPGGAKTAGDYTYSRYVHVYNPVDQAFTNYPYDFGGFDTAALVSGGKMQADGDDLRLRIDGTEVNRWFGTTDGRAINTTDTAIWANVDIPVKTSISLAAAITSTDLEITYSNQEGLPAVIQRLSTAGNRSLIVAAGTTDEEVINYETINTVTRTIGGLTRGAKGTTATAHAAGQVFYHIPFEAVLSYGSSDATAQTVDDTKKPMIELHSTNTSWIFATFYDSTAPERSAQWQPVITKPGLGKLSKYYTGEATALANPATSMGMSLLPYVYFGQYRPDNAEVVWRFHHSAGITAVEAPGEKYRYSSDWAAVAGLQYYDSNTKRYISADNQATPSSDQTWTAFTIESTDTGLFSAARTDIQFILSGSVTGAANNIQSLEIDDVTLTIDSNGVPVKSMTGELSQYRLNAKITNTTTGDYIQLDYPMGVSRTLTVDCDAKTVTYDDGTNAFNALTVSTNRAEWLPLKYGTNTLQFDDAGTQNATIGIEFENRNTL